MTVPVLRQECRSRKLALSVKENGRWRPLRKAEFVKSLEASDINAVSDQTPGIEESPETNRATNCAYDSLATAPATVEVEAVAPAKCNGNQADDDSLKEWRENLTRSSKVVIEHQDGHKYLGIVSGIASASTIPHLADSDRALIVVAKSRIGDESVVVCFAHTYSAETGREIYYGLSRIVPLPQPRTESPYIAEMCLGDDDSDFPEIVLSPDIADDLPEQLDIAEKNSAAGEAETLDIDWQLSTDLDGYRPIEGVPTIGDLVAPQSLQAIGTVIQRATRPPRLGVRWFLNPNLVKLECFISPEKLVKMAIAPQADEEYRAAVTDIIKSSTDLAAAQWRNSLCPGDLVLVEEGDRLRLGQVAERLKAENVLPNVKGREVLIVNISQFEPAIGSSVENFYAHAAFFIDTGRDIYSGSSCLHKPTEDLNFYSTESLASFLATIKTAPQEAELWAASVNSDSNIFLRFDNSPPPDGWTCIGAVDKIAKGQQTIMPMLYHGPYDMNSLGSFLAGVVAADPEIVLWASDLELYADVKCCPPDSICPGWVRIGDIPSIIKSRDDYHGNWTGYGTCGSWGDEDSLEDFVEQYWMKRYLSEVEQALMPEAAEANTSEILEQTTEELKRLEWSADWGKLLLRTRYGVVSRRLLSPEQLLDFRDFLRKNDPGSEEDLLASILGVKKEQLTDYVSKLPFNFDYRSASEEAIAVGDLVSLGYYNDKIGIVCLKQYNKLITVYWVREPETDEYYATPEKFSCSVHTEGELVKTIDISNNIDENFDLPNGLGLSADLKIKAWALPFDLDDYSPSDDQEIDAGAVVGENKSGRIGIVRHSLASNKRAASVIWLRESESSHEYLSTCYIDTLEQKYNLVKLDYNPRFDCQYIIDQFWMNQLSFDKSFLDIMFRIGSHVGLLTIPQLAAGGTVETAQLVLDWMKKAGFFSSNEETYEYCVTALAEWKN